MLASVKHKKFVVVLAAAIAAVLAVAAYAYFSSTGSGTGSATVGSSSPIQLSSTQVGPLYPGGADASVSVSVNNPGSGNEYVGTISGTVADNGSCLGSWFQVEPITFNTTVTHGAGATAGPTKVRMIDSGTNQDACQGKTMTVNWASN
jgi:hypothetical protein